MNIRKFDLWDKCWYQGDEYQVVGIHAESTPNGKSASYDLAFGIDSKLVSGVIHLAVDQAKLLSQLEYRIERIRKLKAELAELEGQK